MRITTYINTTEQEVNSKNFNIIIGISLGNKYFSKENIEKYVSWALEKTNRKVLILIGDELHKINLRVLDKYSEQKTERIISKEVEIKEREILEITKKLSKEQQKLIKMIRFGEILKEEDYQKDLEIIEEEFKNNLEFRKFIYSIVNEHKKVGTKKLTEEELNKIAQYPLMELPAFIKGINYDGILYNLIPYPGLSRLDELSKEIQSGKIFPELAKKLNLARKLAILEAYVD
jgi:tRNA-dependent cyclodipeptide synthase